MPSDIFSFARPPKNKIMLLVVPDCAKSLWVNPEFFPLKWHAPNGACQS
jgi:hypothetical protein